MRSVSLSVHGEDAHLRNSFKIRLTSFHFIYVPIKVLRTLVDVFGFLPGAKDELINCS